MATLRDEDSVEELELSVRASNCLKNAFIETVGELRRMSDAELLRIENLGRLTLKEIREAVPFSDEPLREHRREPHYARDFIPVVELRAVEWLTGIDENPNGPPHYPRYQHTIQYRTAGSARWRSLKCYRVDRAPADYSEERPRAMRND